MWYIRLDYMYMHHTYMYTILANMANVTESRMYSEQYLIRMRCLRQMGTHKNECLCTLVHLQPFRHCPTCMWNYFKEL